MVGLLGCQRTLVAHVQLFIHQYPQVLLGRAALNPSIPQPVLIPGVALTQVQDLHLALLNLMRFTQAHLSSLSRFLWMTCHPSGMSATPFSLVLSADLLRVHSVPLSRSLIGEDVKQYCSHYGPLRDTTRHLYSVVYSEAFVLCASTVFMH